MCKKEQEVLEKLAESIKKLDPMKKEYFSGLADGMALAQQMQEKPVSENEANT